MTRATELARYGYTLDEPNPPAWVFQTRCNWMLHCTNLATGRRHSPGAGHVPICDRCRAWDDEDEAKRRRLNTRSHTNGRSNNG